MPKRRRRLQDHRVVTSTADESGKDPETQAEKNGERVAGRETQTDKEEIENGRRDRKGGEKSCRLCRWLCCAGCCRRNCGASPMSSGEERHAVAPAGSGGRQLPEAVYRQIRAVEAQPSTLTSAGISSFSARVLDKQGQRHSLTGEAVTVQLVEIIKKPGQSLGLYLREGNGLDRSQGVFASRFGEKSELERYGDVIRPGDEILSINNVSVTAMSIDDVVLTLSIPRRLILKTRFSKSKRERQPASMAPVDRPVVVFHKVEESANSSEVPLLSKPTSTANTWLGRRARQQQQEMAAQSSTRFSHPPAIGSSPRAAPFTSRLPPSGQDHQMSPRASSYSTQPLSRPQLNGKPMPLGSISRLSELDNSETVSRTARVPPPRMNSSGVRRAESFSSQPLPSTSALATSSGMTLPRSGDPSGRGEGVPSSSLSRSLCSPVLPRPLRHQHSLEQNHSNSLPRRAIASSRNVKWRKDVMSHGDPFGGDDSDGALSAPEYGGRSSASYYQPLRLSSVGGRTVNDIFSAAEYRNWAEVDEQSRVGSASATGLGVFPASYTLGRQSRWSHAYGDRGRPATARSSSLNSRALLSNSLVGSPMTSRSPGGVETSAILDRLHVSPLMNRRAPLRAAGPGINVDRLNVHSLSGMLFVQIYEGRGLRIPEKQRAVTEEMYCVLEVDEAHRARTGVSTAQHKYRWRETFHIDVYNATQLHFFIYSWHPQHRHSLCHKGSLKLLEAFVIDELNGERLLALSLEPRGQLCVRVGFHDMSTVFRRSINPHTDGVFGVPLARLLQRERRETPLVLSRLIHEIEKRRIDCGGLYILCGAVEKKRMVREELETNPFDSDISIESVPDTNVLACLIKDFMRELPEPLIPAHIHNMLLDAAAMALPNDVEGNRQLVFRIVDCLSLPNKNTLLLVMEHLGLVLSSFMSPTGQPRSLLITIFAPLLLCTADHSLPGVKEPLVHPLDVSQAAATLQLLLDVWPSRTARAAAPEGPQHPSLSAS